MKKNLGNLMLAGWLILSGVIPLLHLSFTGLSTVMAVGAIAAGVLLILGK